jgi:hypothetical protein
MLSLALLDVARIHVEQLPNMAVEVLKAVAVHEPIVLGFVVSAAAGSDCCRNQFVHLTPVLTGERDQCFRAFVGVCDRAWSERLKFGVSNSMT